jgi:hypothetical protein
LFADVIRLVAVLKEMITPFVILSLGNLVFLTQLADVDLTGETFEHDFGLLLAGPVSAFHEYGSFRY